MKGIGQVSDDKRYSIKVPSALQPQGANQTVVSVPACAYNRGASEIVRKETRMPKERRAKNGPSKKAPRPNATQATSLLREDHRRMEGYFEDMEERTDILEKTEIRDLAIAEIRVHKAVVEEAFYPVVGDIFDEALIDEAREELEELEPLLETLETTSPAETAFEPAWQKLARQLAHHIQWEEQEMFVRAEESEDVDLVKLGLRVAELRKEIMAEQPTTNWEVPDAAEDDN
jgi:hypothetical protein